MATDLIAMALAVLSPLPREVTCIKNDGGQLRLSLIEEREGQLYAELSLLDARKGSMLTIPVETSDRGGFSIGCEIVDSYFMGGLDSAVKLAVTELVRRKPYRLRERVPADAVAELHAITAAGHQGGVAVFARVLDVSASGIGLSADQAFTIGDRLRLDTTVKGILISAEVTVVAVGRMAFGRWRTGCQFRGIALQTQHQLDALAKDHSRSTG